MSARLLLVCLLFRSSWLTVVGDRHVGAAGVHRRGGRAVVAVSVGVAGGVPEVQRRIARPGQSRLLQVSPKRKPRIVCSRWRNCSGAAVSSRLLDLDRSGSDATSDAFACWSGGRTDAVSALAFESPLAPSLG
jgi:hypothetical protein